MKLFGGAITASIPDSLLDASDLREVPDNQEVFVGSFAEFDISLIIELLEPVGKNSIVEALVYHVDEVHRVSGLEPMAEHSLETLTIELNKHQFAERVDFVKEKDGYVSLVFGLFRLEEYETDVLITSSLKPQVNKPGVKEVDSQKQVVRNLVMTFKVLDEGLFGKELKDLSENGPHPRPVQRFEG